MYKKLSESIILNLLIASSLLPNYYCFDVDKKNSSKIRMFLGENIVDWTSWNSEHCEAETAIWISYMIRSPLKFQIEF